MTDQKHYILLTIVITLCLQTACSSSVSQESVTVKTDPAEFSAAIAKADALYRQRANTAKLSEAVDILAGFRKPDDRNYEVEWKFAKYSYFLGSITKDEKESEKIFEKGRDAGKIASSMEPSKPDGYFWYAANLGEIARINPITVGVKSVGDIRSAMNKVIEIQPNYQNSNAYDALAQLEMETRLYGGSADKAVVLLEKALQTEKANGELHLHLAEAYLAVKRPAEARHQLDLLLQMAPDPEFAAEHAETVEEAKKMIKNKF